MRRQAGSPLVHAPASEGEGSQGILQVHAMEWGYRGCMGCLLCSQRGRPPACMRGQGRGQGMLIGNAMMQYTRLRARVSGRED